MTNKENKKSTMTQKDKIQLTIDALKAFNDGYNALINAWDKFDLDQLDANELYPFQESFYDIDIGNWTEIAIDELEALKATMSLRELGYDV